MNISRQPVAVLGHETALQVYLDALLQDMAGSIHPEEPQKTRADEKILEINNIIAPVTENAQEIASPQTVTGAAPTAKVLTWAMASFQALLVSTNGIKMVVPLIKLHSIVNLTIPIKAVPSDTAWFSGLFPWRGTYVKVIDICKLMAMESAGFAAPEEGAPKRLVLINDGSWGFVCDDFSKVFTVDPSQVQWRADRTRHAWLAGTVIEHMYALLDVDEFTLHISGGTINAC